MKKILLLFFLISQNFCSASVWLSEPDFPEYGVQVYSDSSEPYDVYLGYAYKDTSLDIPAIATELAGNNAKINQVKSEPYSAMIHLFSGTSPEAGLHFNIEQHYSFVALYDSNMQIIGSLVDTLTPFTMAYIPDKYTIGPNEIIELKAYQYNIFRPSDIESKWIEGVDCLQDDYNGYWSINGTNVPRNCSYEYLVNNLGLGIGTHELQLNVFWDFDGEGFILDDKAYTTITIVPEPVSFSLFTLAGLVLFRKCR